MADGLVPVTRGASSSSREGQVAATVAAQLPSLATADVGSDRLELRGDADLRAVCLHASGATFCSPAGPASARVVEGSFLVDGRWIVVAVATAPHHGHARTRPPGRSSSGAWSFVEAFPDPR